MHSDTSVKTPTGREDPEPDRRAGWAMATWLQLGFLGLVLFVSSGTLAWPMGWAYLAVTAGMALVNRVYFSRNPLPSSCRQGRPRRVKTRLEMSLDFVLVLTMFVLPLTAGLDRRLAWSPPFPAALQAGALLVFVAGHALATWAMVSNPFFAATVLAKRQLKFGEGPGQFTICSGPYRLVRHPGYSGWLLSCIALPFMLGSLWTLIPAGVVAASLAIHTNHEDRSLLADLSGYGDYARQVPSRLIPGIW